jgi:superfamily I DNA/RNA helicase
METPKITSEAYKEEGGPILLIAGPGTGKTFQLAKRIQFLLTLGVLPKEITVITFTREAAISMQAKIAEEGKEEFVPEEQRPKQICTMHSLGHQIITENPSLVRLQNGFTVLESEATKELLILDSALSLGYSPKDAKIAASDRTTANRSRSEISTKILERYEAILRASNTVDFDDQIALAVEILKTDKASRDKFSQTAKHLLVDEYQDINSDQFDLIRLLAAQNPSGLFVVGDDDQSIYTFRGASPDFIRTFDKHFGQVVKILQMDRSWRCRRSILLSAIKVVEAHDTGHLPKAEPQFVLPEAGEVYIHNCPTDDKEATVIASIIKDDIEKSGKNKYTAFVLVPSPLYARMISVALNALKIRHDLPHNVPTATQILLDAKAWLENRIANIACRVVVEHVIQALSFPRSKITEGRNTARQRVASLWQTTIDSHSTFWETLQRAGETDPVLGSIKAALETLSVAHGGVLADFLKAAVEVLRPWKNTEKFFADVSAQAQFPQGQPGCYEVRVLTLRKSKGLEANSVFVVGLEDGTIPKDSTQEARAEAARLMYVGMTRAKDKLHLFHVSTRSGATTFSSKSHQLRPSRFLAALPKEHVKTQYHMRKSTVVRSKAARAGT